MQTVQATLAAAIAVVALAASPATSVSAEGSRKLVLTIAIDGAIGPATASYVKDALAKASERRAEAVILRLNTPGGLVTSMRETIADVLASPVPVIGYVAPSGAHAASAGTYLLYATHIAAMAPGTNLGAATPVQIGSPVPGLPSITPDKDGRDKKDSTQQTEPKDAMMAKATNDAVAFIRSLAELRGRNADWAEKAVREAASLSASAALQASVIDLIARDPVELLRQIDGRVVELPGGDKRHLVTKDATIETIDSGWIAQFLSVITNPNVAFILLLVGIYGLIFEFMSPGAVAPGVVGTICLLLGLYALNLLPTNYAGLGLMMLGIALLIIETFNPTVVLGLGGAIALLLGALMLFRIEAPGYRLSWTLIGIVTAMFIGLALIVLGSLQRARKAPARVGAQAMRGLRAEVLDWNDIEGHVFTQGERWQARGNGRDSQHHGSDTDGASPAGTQRRRRRCAMMLDYITYSLLAIILIAFLSSAIRILREYERGIVFTLGRFTGVKGPGLFILIPFVQQMVKADLRVMVQDVPPQDVISRDNVSVKVNAVLYFRIVDPERAIIKVGNYMAATSQLAQTTLRSVLGKHELDEMLAERDKLNADIQEILDQQTDAWGIKVTNIEIKDIDLNDNMVRAIAKQAEAERLRRAKVINAIGEQQAAEKLVEAGRILALEPQAMQLRYFAALHDIAGERSSTVVFPLPMDLLSHITPRPGGTS